MPSIPIPPSSTRRPPPRRPPFAAALAVCLLAAAAGAAAIPPEEQASGAAGRSTATDAAETSGERPAPPAGKAEASTAPAAAADTAPGRPPVMIRRSSGRGAPDRAQMRTWHRDYRRRMAPVKRALGELLAARRAYRPSELGPECRALAQALAELAAEPLPVAPDLAVDLHLKRLLRPLDGAAQACTEELPARTSHHLLLAGRALRDLELAMLKYGLEP